MSTEDALLAAILAEPDDDTPRLVYADWLEENGDAERAEFIRLQCPTGGAGSDPRAEDRAAELEERNRGRWLAGVPRFAGMTWEFRRGFPEILVVDGEFLLERYDAVRRVRWLRRLCVAGVLNWTIREFVSRSWNPRWAELELQIYGTDPDYTPGIAAFARSPQARQLRWLRLAVFQWPLSPQAISELAHSEYLDQLCELRFVGELNLPLLAPLRDRFGDRLILEGS